MTSKLVNERTTWEARRPVAPLDVCRTDLLGDTAS